MHPNSLYFGPKDLYSEYFKAEVLTILVQGP